MKRIHTFLVSAVLLAGLGSCEMTDGLLDKTEVTDLNRQKTFSDSTLTFAFLNTAYRDIAFNWEYQKYATSHTGTTDATDDGVSSVSNNGAIHPMVTGTLSPASNSPYRYEWETTYKNIRHLNVFLANVDVSPLSGAKKTRLKAEARFLRAWYYSIVLKYFGGAVLMGDQVIDAEHQFEEKRSTYEETVNYLVNELDAAARDLPYSHTGNDFGRVTKGAAVALKARILLFAASPLFNGGNIGVELGASPEQIAVAGYPTYDANRWRLAQNAAYDVIDLNEYSLYEDPEAASNPPGYSFSRVFLKRVNSEYIFQYNLPLNRDLEAYFFTRSRNSSTSSMPTHNLASSFGMINGKRTFEEGSGFDPANPFVNRDPRFNYTIAFNGTVWHNGATNTKTPIFTYFGAPLDGYNPSTFHTGYFWRKMQEENTAWNGGGGTRRGLCL